jgi:glycosyltransferase involved in cell wall biosynthesis
MRVAWFTPFSERSDVGAHSRCIVEALPAEIRRAACLFVNENRKGVTYRSSLPTVKLSDTFDPGILDAFDHAVMNIGNSQENHYYINNLCLQYRSVVVVHDIIMQHYLAWMLFEERKNPERYAELMVHHYGDRALSILESSRLLHSGRTPRYAPWDSVHSASFPLLEPFVERAQAVVVHSKFAERVVERMTKAPIIRLFLPYDKKPRPVPRTAEGKRHVDFVAIGHINRAKFLHLGIAAIRTSDLLRASARFWIVGMPNDAQYAAELEQQARALGLGKSVIFEYGVSESRLVEIKADADVFVNLRFPNTESASGSFTEQLACAKPVIVMNTGCYAEVPDNCVVKITSTDDVSALSAAMERLVQDEKYRRSLGKAAERYVKERTAKAYGEKLTAGLANLPAATIGPDGHEPGSSVVEARWPDGHWLLAKPDAAATLEVWSRLGPAQCARLLFLVLRGDSPGEPLRDAVASLLQKVEQPDRARAILRYLSIRRMVREHAAFYPTDFDSTLDAVVAGLLLAIDRSDFARLLYAAILGRTASDEEASAYASRLADYKHARDVVVEFMNSVEFRRRKLRSEFAELLTKVLAPAGEFLLTQRVSAPVLAHRVSFGADAHGARQYLNGAWHPSEGDGVWSRGCEAGLVFRLPFEAAQGDSVVLAARVACTKHTGPRKCSFKMSKRDIGTYTFRDDGRALIRIPLEGASDEEVVALRLSLDAAAKPSEYGEADSRTLGMFLYEMFLERADVRLPRPQLAQAARTASW